MQHSGSIGIRWLLSPAARAPDHAELLDHRRAWLRGGMHVERRHWSDSPIRKDRFRSPCRALRTLSDRWSGSAGAQKTPFCCGSSAADGSLAEPASDVPARTVLGVEIDRLGEIVDAGFALVGEILVLHPEEILRHDEIGERGAVLMRGDVGKLFAEGDEARIVERRRRRHRDRLVGLDRRRRRRLEPPPGRFKPCCAKPAAAASVPIMRAARLSGGRKADGASQKSPVRKSAQ